MSDSRTATAEREQEYWDNCALFGEEVQYSVAGAGTRPLVRYWGEHAQELAKRRAQLKFLAMVKDLTLE